ncbi:hypothetical protein [Dactylosporangium sp. NPDC005555]|uniref:hypothetical protein n=1 Tax=Dactylosporangium sp. NPDC005555 TaxID=3154889 RepID=UPI0033ACE4C5
MAYQLIDNEPPAGSIEHATFVAFLPGRACAALPGPALISGTVLPGVDRDRADQHGAAAGQGAEFHERRH